MSEPAFPTTNWISSEEIEYQYDGMTLRDYFAAKAMQGMISEFRSERPASVWKKHLCKAAYQVADAMLEARES